MAIPALSAAVLSAVWLGAGGSATAKAPARAASAPVAGEESIAALSGWTVREDPRDRGIAAGWQRGGFGGAKVTVPYALRADALTGRAGVLNYEGSVAWFGTSFSAATAGPYAISFASASYDARVWVDGHALGEHRGAYLPFELRARLAAGRHVLVVRVDWRDPGRQSLEGFHRTWFNWGGLEGPVAVRALGASELSEATLQTTLAPAGGPPAATVAVSVQVHNGGPARTIQPEGQLARGGATIPLRFAAVALEHGQTATARATATVAEPALWSPSQPSLYQLKLVVAGESSYTAQVGLREIGWHGGRLFLNGSRLILHGATIQQDAPGHGDALSGADEVAIVHELKAIGANAARAQHPLDATMLERLDAAGILVWQGIGPVEGAGNWMSNTPRLLGEAEQQARTAVQAEQLHPSVVAWNLVDEVAHNGHDAQETQYVQDTARWLHAHDPTRPVAVDVWGDHPPERAGALYAHIDAIAETDYSGWYDHPYDTPAQLAGEMRSRLAAMERTFPGRVLLISEFGAESNTLNPSGAPGGYGYQARLLAEHVRTYESDPRLSGMLIWLLRDYPLNPTFQGGSIHGVLPNLRLIEGLNQKGLFTRQGRAKPAAGVVARLFARLPAD